MFRPFKYSLHFRKHNCTLRDFKFSWRWVWSSESSGTMEAAHTSETSVDIQLRTVSTSQKILRLIAHYSTAQKVRPKTVTHSKWCCQHITLYQIYIMDFNDAAANCISCLSCLNTVLWADMSPLSLPMFHLNKWQNTMAYCYLLGCGVM
jgi:hypothetical protein